MGLKWNGEAVKHELRAASWAGVVRATIYTHTKLVEETGVSAKVGTGTTAADYQASKPGEPPRKRTGWMQRHIMFELDEANGRGRLGIAKNAIYGIFLELGTKRVKARPWLLATVTKYRAQIKALLTLKS